MSQQIADLQSRIESKREEAEEAAREWQRAAGRFLAQQYTELVERAVTEKHPDRAQELGREGLGALKTELRHLIDDIDNVVAAELNRDELWEHRGAVDTTAYGGYGDRLHGSPLDEPMRRALGRVAPLLLDRGLDEDRAWQEREGQRRWSYALDQSDEMTERMADYRDRLKELRQLQRDLDKAEREEKESAARSLWDEV
jgi:hypothetical protein